MTARAENTPLVRVRHGQPTDCELAAVVAVVARIGAEGRASQSASSSGPASAWTERASLLRRQVTPGPLAWRFSATPRP